MIYITGDTHGGFQRFTAKNFPQQRQMSRNDYVIVTGDFGGVWDDLPREAYWLDWLEENPIPRCLYPATTKTSASWRSILWRSDMAAGYSVSGPMCST